MGKVGMIIKAAAKFGPVAYPAVKRVASMLRDNPELAKQAQKVVDGFAKARSARSRPESLRRSVGVLRAQAQRALSAATTPDDVARAEGWLAQADKLDGAIDLMSVHDRKAQTKDADAVESRVEELFAQIFTALVQDDGVSDTRQIPPA